MNAYAVRIAWDSPPHCQAGWRDVGLHHGVSVVIIRDGGSQPGHTRSAAAAGYGVVFEFLPHVNPPSKAWAEVLDHPTATICETNEVALVRGKG